MQDSLAASDPRSLARLMELGAVGPTLWRVEDLGAALRHQWDADLVEELSAVAPETALEAGFLARSCKPEIRTFGDLLGAGAPPAQLLTMAKDYAKSLREDPEAPLPPDVASVIYFLCAGLARFRLRRSISALEDAALREGLKWVATRPWALPQARKLARRALRAAEAPARRR